MRQDQFAAALAQADYYWTVFVNGVTHKFLQEWEAVRFRDAMAALYGRTSSLVGPVERVGGLASREGETR